MGELEALVEKVTDDSTLEAQAREALGVPPEWRIYMWKSFGLTAKTNGRGIRVKGGIPRPLKSGKNKGRPTWRDKVSEREIVITDAQRADWLRAWEARTGLCHICKGRKEEWAGWSAAEGTKLRPCTRCDATGKAQPDKEPRV